MKLISFLIISFLMLNTYLPLNDTFIMKYESKTDLKGRFRKSKPCVISSNTNSPEYKHTNWHIPSEGISYKINYLTKPANLTNGQVDGAMQQALQAWSIADNKKKFNYLGVESAIMKPKQDGVNLILWRSLPRSTAAVTYAWYSKLDGKLKETDTVFNKNYPWSVNDTVPGDCGGHDNYYDLQNVATHEFGHWLGLGDLYTDSAKDLTMYGYVTTSELKKSSLGTGDIQGLRTKSP